MSFLIIGASSGLGRDLAYQFAKNKKNIVICSRDARDLKFLKTDIENKFKIKVKIIEVDFSFVENVKKKIDFNKKFFHKIKGILFPIGQMNVQDNINLDKKLANNIVTSNFTSVAYLASNFALNKKKSGFLVGFGSVSGHLGRSQNPYYSASKRALESFFESLILANKNNQLCIQFYTLGYLNTNLSFGKNLYLPKASTKLLAKIVFKNLYKKNKKFFFPSWWSLVVSLIKILPFEFILFFSKFLKR